MGTFTFNLRFPGQYYDAESGLNYNMFRDYNPGTGRYIQSDPIGLWGEQFSTYGYVKDSPLYLIDPLGLAGARPPAKSGGNQESGGTDAATIAAAGAGLLGISGSAVGAGLGYGLIGGGAGWLGASETGGSSYDRAVGAGLGFGLGALSGPLGDYFELQGTGLSLLGAGVGGAGNFLGQYSANQHEAGEKGEIMCMSSKPINWWGVGGDALGAGFGGGIFGPLGGAGWFGRAMGGLYGGQMEAAGAGIGSRLGGGQ